MTTDEPKPEHDKPEKGEFFLFSNALCEAIITTDELTKTQIRLLHYIARMTWGWRRKRFLFSQKVACEQLKVDKSLMSRSINALINADILTTQKGEVGINKYTDQWNLPLLEEMNDRAKTKKQLQKRQLDDLGGGQKDNSCKKGQLEVDKKTTDTGPEHPNNANTAIPKNSIKDSIIINPPYPPPETKNGVDLLEGIYSEIRRRCPPFSQNDYQAMRQAIATGLPLEDIERIIREVAAKKKDGVKGFQYFTVCIEAEAKRREAINKPIPTKEVKQDGPRPNPPSSGETIGPLWAKLRERDGNLWKVQPDTKGDTPPLQAG